MEKKAEESKNSMISREELRATILELEHDMLTKLLGKDDKPDSEGGFTNDELAAGMSMLVLFADSLLERYAVEK